MSSLNLPEHDVKIKEIDGRRLIFDALRRRYVALTPEEFVRQRFVGYLVHSLHYPVSLLANEVELSVGSKRLRCDTVLFSRDLEPRMIIEYKAPMVKITQRVFDQITVYNLLLRVDYLVVSNGIEHFCCKMNYPSRSYNFLERIPDFAEL